MKFAKELAQTAALLPTNLRMACFPYRAWKKITRHSDTVLPSLISECFRIDRVFRTSLKARFSTYRKRDLLAFAQVNRKAVAKMCKRLDKHRATTAHRTWLSGRQHAYAFIEGSLLTRLRLEVDFDGYMCPICFDSEPGVGVVISKCGHIMCAACALHFAGMKGRCGAVCNLLSHAPRAAVCPECRCPQPFSHFKTVPRSLCTALIEPNFWQHGL